MQKIVLYTGVLCFITLFSCVSSRQDGLAEHEDWRVLTERAKTFTAFPGGYGGQLSVTSFGSDPKTFNPITSSETSSWEVLEFIFDGLVTFDPVSEEIVPCLAKSWTSSDEFRIYDFDLRSDVLWSDGKAFTADDVVFTFDVIYDKKNLSNARENLLVNGRRIRVEKTGSHSVRMVLPSRFAPFLKVIAGSSAPILPKHKLEDAARGGRFNSSWEVNTPVKEIVGTGPFVIESYTPSQRLVLKRNNRYWRRDREGNRLPYLDKILFQYVKDISSEMLKFKNRESDFYFMRGEDFPVLKPLEKQLDFTIYNMGPQLGDVSLFFNMNLDTNPKTGTPFVEPHKLKWFRSRSFRQAVAHCIDREQIINIVHNGLAIPQHSPMNEASGYFYNPDIRKISFNLDSARILLESIGLTDRTGNGFLEDTEGNPVEFSLYTNSGNTEREKYCEIIRKDLESVGIRVHYRPLEFNNIVDKLVHSYDWETIILGMTGSNEPHEGNNVWQSSAMNHQWYPYQKSPSTPWEARIDTIFNLAAREMDRTKRKELYDEWLNIFGEEQPYIPIVAKFRLFAVRNKFGNINPVPIAEAGYYNKKRFFYNIEEVYIADRVEK